MTHAKRVALVGELLALFDGDSERAALRVSALSGIDIDTARKIIGAPTSRGIAPIYFNLIKLCIRNDVLVRKNRYFATLIKSMRGLLDACNIEYEAPTFDEFKQSIKEPCHD